MARRLVGHGSPVRRSVAAAALAALVIATTAGGGGCGGESGDDGADGPRTVAPDGAPYTYVIPAGFQKLKDTTVVGSVGSESHVSGYALDDVNLIRVSVYQLREDTTGTDPAELKRQLDDVIASAATQAGATAGPVEEATVAGQPAFRYLIENVRTPSGKTATDLTYVLFKGRNEVQLVCQYRTDRKAEIDRACDTVRDSLTLE